MSTPNAVDPAKDLDITLSAGEMRLTVSPHGASLRGLSRVPPGGDAAEIITEYRGAANKVAGQGDVLIPFPGRVRDGSYTFSGKSYQLPKNDSESPSAIHGFVRTMDWLVQSRTDHEVTFRLKLDAAEFRDKGYPFSLDIKVTYRATETGMECNYSIANIGAQTAPVAAGFHPYFSVGSEHVDTNELKLPFGSYLEFDGLLPTGRVLPVAATPLDFRESRAIGSTRLNTCFAAPQRDADGLARVVLTNGDHGRRVTVWMDESCPYVVLYSGDPLPEDLRRRSLAIEPMSCASDAFNHAEWGLVSLQPGQAFRGSWGVVAEY